MDGDESKGRFNRERNRENILLCTRCGLPYKAGDTLCMYCGLELNKAYKPSLKDRWVHYINQRKWNKQKKRIKRSRIYSSARKKNTLTKKVIMYIVGTALTVTGIALFLSSSVSKSFQTWLISILFLLYGLFTLMYTYKN